MTKFAKKSLSFILLVLLTSACYADVPIYRMSNAVNLLASACKPAVNVKAITTESLAYLHINIGENSPYASAQVKLLISDTGNRYLLIHLMSRYYFSSRIIRVNLNSDNRITYPIILNYHLKKSDFIAQSNPLNVLLDKKPSCPSEYMNSRPLVVVVSPAYSDTSSVYQSINKISKAVDANPQYQLVQLLDKNATVENYQNVLACPNLKYFIHFGGSDDYGQSFVLANGDFKATYFSENPQLNFGNKAISLDSCNLFDQVSQGFCPILTKMKHKLSVFSAGSSQLLIWGSAETYACFWKNVLEGASMTQKTLQQCAVKYDPSVPNSQAGIYFVGARNSSNQLVIQTNQRKVIVTPRDYTVLKLSSGEMVTRYAMKESDGQSYTCTPNPMNRITLINNPKLKAAEFGLSLEGNNCQYTEISRIVRNGNITRDIYGFSPAQSCFHLPNKPKFGALTLSSNIGLVDMNCNYLLSWLQRINSSPTSLDWSYLVSEFDNSHSLICTFKLDKFKKEIASLHINIRKSSSLPGMLAGKLVM